MDTFEFNKYAMAVLGTVFIMMSLSFISDSIFHAEKPEKPGYAIEVASTDSSEGASGETSGPAFEPISAMLASADVAAGEKVAKKCLACHSFEKGGKSKVGPPLFGIIDGDIAKVGGFSYSAPLVAFADGKKWDYETLNGFLWKPKAIVKGTAMGFAGLKKVADRANLVAYLRSLSDSPSPLPTN